MNSPAHGGYVVTNDDAIWSASDTADAAWAQFLADMKSSGVTLLRDDQDEVADSDGPWTRASGYKLISASAALLAEVDDRGGNIAWRTVGGVACTLTEAEAG